jgi:transketolase
MSQSRVQQQIGNAPTDLADMAKCLRVLCADMVENAGSGHPGMPMGMADVATVLFARHLNIDPAHPEWIKRDRFVLSAGHGSALAYALLNLLGFPEMSMQQLKQLRREGSLTPGHPEFGHTAGIECTTGPLGQGFATAVGMAIAEEKLRAEFGDALVGHRTFVIAGDGCLMEGINHEAAALAGHLRLGNLVVLFDDNSISIDGPVAIASSEDVPARFASYGWNTIAVDGHDLDDIDTALASAGDGGRPTLIACRTQIGQGAPTKAGSSGIHGSPLGATEVAAMRSKLGWEHDPFQLPAALIEAWKEVGRTGGRRWSAWQEVVARQPKHVAARIEAIERRQVPMLSDDAARAMREQALARTAPIATRVSSKQVLEQIVPECPWLLGGSADLSSSNGTRVAAQHEFTATDRSGDYLRYGVREHAMAAAMNGIALSGAFVPYGGTFLVFSDYCRPAIRLAALMKLRVVYVFTHDSIGLGEDGPTHQPIEHLASLRLIPGVRVLRPADAVEVAECWELALEYDGPSVLALSRQDLPLLRDDAAANRSAAGGYVLARGRGSPDVTFMATGSEVHVAMEARAKLIERGIDAQVVSVPCIERLEARGPEALQQLQSGLCVAVEAGSSLPWRHIVGRDGLVCGIDQFGESAAGERLFEKLGLTPDVVVERVLAQMARQGVPA